MANAVIILADRPDGSVSVECELMPDASGIELAERTKAQRVFRELMRFFAQTLEAEVEADYVVDSDRASSSSDLDGHQ